MKEERRSWREEREEERAEWEKEKRILVKRINVLEWKEEEREREREKENEHCD